MHALHSLCPYACTCQYHNRWAGCNIWHKPLRNARSGRTIYLPVKLHPLPVPPTLATDHRSAPPQTTDKILSVPKRGIQKSTQKDTRYCVQIWDEWRKYHKKSTGTEILPLQLPPHQLNTLLTMFDFEASKKTSKVHPPNTHHFLLHKACAPDWEINRQISQGYQGSRHHWMPKKQLQGRSFGPNRHFDKGRRK